MIMSIQDFDDQQKTKNTKNDIADTIGTHAGAFLKAGWNNLIKTVSAGGKRPWQEENTLPPIKDNQIGIKDENREKDKITVRKPLPIPAEKK